VMTVGQLRSIPLRPSLLWFAGASVATFLVEVLGVATGAIFGPYHYLDVLGFSLAGVPLIIGLNWVLAVWGIHSAIRAVFPGWSRWALALLTGVGCILFDIVLEPVAIKLGYWVWHDGTIPLQNYLAWGIIGTSVSVFLPLRQEGAPVPLVLSWYVLIQTLFFAGINLWILLGLIA